MNNKKLLILILCLPILLVEILIPPVFGQVIRINSGAWMNIAGDAYIKLDNGSFINNGSYIKGTETVTFSGTSAKTISGSSNTDMNSVSVINTGGITSQSGLFTANDLTIGNGSRFTIESAKAVTVKGTLTNNAGESGLVVQSTIDGTGSLLHNTASVNATVQRYMNNTDWSNWKDGWHFLSSPVSSQAISPDFTAGPSDFYCWHEPSNLWVNYRNTSTAPVWSTANTLNNGSGSNEAANFLIGKGYMAAYDNEGTKSFIGILNVSGIPVTGLAVTGTAANNRSWHLLGNPFSCALAWDASSAWNLANIAGVAKIWNELNQSYTDLTSSPVTYIPATNGFMVQVTSGTGSLTMPAEKRVQNTQSFYKSGNIPALKLTLRNLNEGNAQECNVVFNPEATVGFDLMYDSEFLAGFGPEFYAEAGNERLSTNALPELTQELQVPFKFIPTNDTRYQIEVLGIESIPYTSYLLDKKTGAEHNLALNPVYLFTAARGDAPERFVLRFDALSFADFSEEDKAADDFLIYGLDDAITVISSYLQDGKVTVTDMAGRNVANDKIAAGSTIKINMHGQTGLFIVSVLTGKGISNRKVVVN